MLRILRRVWNLFFVHFACNLSHNCSLRCLRIKLSSIEYHVAYRFSIEFHKSCLDFFGYVFSHLLLRVLCIWLEDIKLCHNYTDHREVFLFNAWHCIFELIEYLVDSWVERDSNKYCVQRLVLKPVSDHSRVLVDIHSWSSPWSIAKPHLAIRISELNFYKLSGEWLSGILCILLWPRQFVEVGCLTSSYLAQENTCEITVCFIWLVTFWLHSVFCLVF